MVIPKGHRTLRFLHPYFPPPPPPKKKVRFGRYKYGPVKRPTLSCVILMSSTYPPPAPSPTYAWMWKTADETRDTGIWHHTRDYIPYSFSNSAVGSLTSHGPLGTSVLWRALWFIVLIWSRWLESLTVADVITKAALTWVLVRQEFEPVATIPHGTVPCSTNATELWTG